MESSRKAQTSVEFLVLLAIALVILLVVVVVSQNQLGTVASIKNQNDASNSAMDIDSAAKEVYSQGEGAKKQVYVVLPSSYDPTNSFVANRSIRIRAGGTDYAAVENFDVYGTLPGSSGGQWVWVISEGSRVRIGAAMLLLSTNSIYQLMNSNSTVNTSYAFTNVWSANITVTQTVVWNNTNLTMAVSSAGPFTLAPGKNQSITLIFASAPSAIGFYNGEIDYSATDGVTNETERLPITVEVPFQNVVLNQPPLNVSPDSWSVSLTPGNGTNQTFKICTNSATSLTGVTFTPSSGSPGSWVTGTSPLGALAAGTCLNDTLNLTVPSNASTAVYTGSILLTGSGASNAQATISLYVYVQPTSMGSGNNSVTNLGSGMCPVGSEDQGPPLCDCQLATVYVQNGTIVGGPDNGQHYTGTLRSFTNNAIVAGTTGNDIINVSGSNGALVCTDVGTDTVYVGGGTTNTVILGNGSDTVIVGDGNNNIIYGGGGNDNITVGNGNDDIDGSSGNDNIVTGGGNNIIFGGSGNDVITVGDGNNVICGVGGTNIVNVGAGYNTVDGGIGYTYVNGGSSKRDDCYRVQNISAGCTTHSGYYSTCGSG